MSGARQSCGVLVMIALLLSASACGDSPTQPSNDTPPGTIDVAGEWSGSWTYTAAGVTVTDEVTMTLGMSGGMASGSWTAASGASGQVSFSSQATMSGTLTINQAVLGQSSCNGSTTIAGTAAGARLDFTVADIAPSGVCQWGTGGRFVVTR